METQKQSRNPMPKVVSGVIFTVVLVTLVRGYIRSQLSLPPINFSSEKQLYNPPNYNPFDHSLEQDLANSRQLELNRREHHRNIMYQLTANEQQARIIENIDLLSILVIIAGSTCWSVYCFKLKQ
ncbi:hypothetical protein [Floridanema aerugineum]|uniref:Uncharacterized protein n=1 Tax=Floridaenema aerugineum BLCC-F46 TaxID=3153654 RepID=A0ABV4X7X5_9CYAN